MAQYLEAIEYDLRRPAEQGWTAKKTLEQTEPHFRRQGALFLRKSAKSVRADQLRLVVSSEPFFRVPTQMLLDILVELLHEAGVMGPATIGGREGTALDVLRYEQDRIIQRVLQKDDEVVAPEAMGAGEQQLQAAADEGEETEEEGEEGDETVAVQMVIDVKNMFNTFLWTRLAQAAIQMGLHPDAIIWLLKLNFEKEVIVRNGEQAAVVPAHSDLIIGSPEAMVTALVGQAPFYEGARRFLQAALEDKETGEPLRDFPSAAAIEEADRQASAWMKKNSSRLDAFSKPWTAYGVEDVHERFKEPEKEPQAVGDGRMWELRREDEQVQGAQAWNRFSVKICVDDACFLASLRLKHVMDGRAGLLFRRLLCYVRDAFLVSELFIAKDEYKLVVISNRPLEGKEEIARAIVQDFKLLGILPRVVFDSKVVGLRFSSDPFATIDAQIRLSIGFARWTCAQTRASLGFYVDGGILLDVAMFSFMSMIIHLLPGFIDRAPDMQTIEDLEEKMAGGVLEELGIEAKNVERLMGATGATKKADLAFSPLTGIERPSEMGGRIVRNYSVKWLAQTGTEGRVHAPELFAILDERASAKGGAAPDKVKLAPAARQRQRYNWLRNFAEESRPAVAASAVGEDFVAVITVEGRRARIHFTTQGAAPVRDGQPGSARKFVTESPIGFGRDAPEEVAAAGAWSVAAALTYATTTLKEPLRDGHSGCKKLLVHGLESLPLPMSFVQEELWASVHALRGIGVVVEFRIGGAQLRWRDPASFQEERDGELGPPVEKLQINFYDAQYLTEDGSQKFANMAAPFYLRDLKEMKSWREFKNTIGDICARL
eukprot:g16850.t1